MERVRSPLSPASLKRRLRHVSRSFLKFGPFISTKPLSNVFGFDRGQPIDRFYIERFLARHAADIKGHVLEIGDDAYSRRFGGNRIVHQDVLHVDGSNSSATILGDISMPDVLPAESFDCLVIT